MSSSIIATILSSLLLALCGAAPALDDVQLLFLKFQKEHSKVYTSEIESAYRFRSFELSLARIGAMGGDNTTSYTKFSDMSPEEFRMTHTGLIANLSTHRELPRVNVSECLTCDRFPGILDSTDDSIDWVSKGAVTPVKNQQQCGSCWAFSTIGCLEGAHFVATGSLVSLSEEQLVSCDTTDAGCKGGQFSDADAYISKVGGVVTEESYPYTAGSGTAPACDKSKLTSFAASIKSYGQVASQASDEDKLKTALYSLGPISVGINAGLLQDYQKGVLDPTATTCDPTAIDHGVLVVGFGTDNGVDYWKIKNSWDTTWGEEGYFRLSYGKNSCGITAMAFHAVATSSGPSPTPTPTPTPTPPTPTPTPPSPSPPSSGCCMFADASCSSGETCCKSECKNPDTCSYTEIGCKGPSGAVHHCQWTGTKCVVP